MKGKQTTSFTHEYGLTNEELSVLNRIEADAQRATMKFVAQLLSKRKAGVDLEKGKYLFRIDKAQSTLKVKQIVPNVKVGTDNYADWKGWG